MSHCYFFSAKFSAQYIKARSANTAKSAALSLGHAILEESFDLDDRFCDDDDNDDDDDDDDDDLETSWQKKKLFSNLFNIQK